MDYNDLSVKLCSPKPIYIDGVPIFPVSLQTISDVGYMRFNAELRLLCLTVDDVKNLTGNDISEIGVFTYLVGCALSDHKLMNALLFWLSTITHNRMIFSKKRLCFTCGAFDITKDNFEEIQFVIRCRNGLQDIVEEEDNPDNEAARRILQRRKEERLKRKRAKVRDEESEITLSDLISILASGLGMTMHEIMSYDLYQFNDQFNRLKIMDDYEVSVQALLHGAKKEDIHFTHWITKINRDKDD